MNIESSLSTFRVNEGTPCIVQKPRKYALAAFVFYSYWINLR